MRNRIACGLWLSLLPTFANAESLLEYSHRYIALRNTGSLESGHLDLWSWNAIHQRTAPPNQSLVGSSGLDVFAADPADTNIVAMGEGGRAGVASSFEVLTGLGGHEQISWSGWFNSEEELLGNGAVLLSIPGQIEVVGGSGPFVGGLDVTLWHNNDAEPVRLSTQPLSFDRPNDDWVHWAVTYDSQIESGNLKLYRGTESEPTSLVSQVSVKDAGVISTPTDVLSIGNSVVGENAYQTPFRGFIRDTRIEDQALTADELREQKPSEWPFPQLIADFDHDGDNDAADRTIHTVGWTGYRPRYTGTSQFEEGDVDLDGDVDALDGLYIASLIACLPTLDRRNAKPATVCEFSTTETKDKPPIARYNPLTGSVQLDASNTSHGVIAGFVFGDDEGNLLPNNLTMSENGNAGPYLDVGTNTDLQPNQVGQSDPINGVLVRSHLIDLGKILPPHLGYTSLELESTIETRLAMSESLNLPQELRFVIDGLTPGDVDFDTDVDSRDRTVLLSNWTGATARGESHLRFPEGDFDGDGDVDSADATTLVTQWTGAKTENPLITIVPEPKPMSLWIVGILALCIRRRFTVSSPRRRS